MGKIQIIVSYLGKRDCFSKSQLLMNVFQVRENGIYPKIILSTPANLIQIKIDINHIHL